ncbi:MAG: hypothetical protein HYR55_20310 [Acidobacteria bacterium]|nr:hypothetical protein [Acidobacteriota bacterium]MBI3658008.1 hypothetical protein [Acidobacteriota bacterium]
MRKPSCLFALFLLMSLVISLVGLPSVIFGSGTSAVLLQEFGYAGDKVTIKGEFPENSRISVGNQPAEIMEANEEFITFVTPAGDPGEKVVVVRSSDEVEVARVEDFLQLAGSVDDPDDPAAQSPKLDSVRPGRIWVGQEDTTIEITGLYFGLGNPGDITISFDSIPAPDVWDATTFHIKTRMPAGLRPDSGPITVLVRNTLNQREASTTILYVSKDPYDSGVDDGPVGVAQCGSLSFSASRGLLGSKVSLVIGNPPIDFEPDVRFEYDTRSTRVTHCHRVGNRWDYGVPDMGLAGPALIRLRVANCQEGPANPTPFQFMVPPELQGNPPINPSSGPSGTPVEITVKNLVQFRSTLLLSEILLSSVDGGLWTHRFRSAQICRDNPSCPVNVLTVDEDAGFYKVRFMMPREFHPGKVNTSLYYVYTPCGTETRVSVSLPPVVFTVGPPSNFTMRITDPTERPPRRVVVHGASAEYTLALQNDTGQPVDLFLSVLAISLRGATCRFKDGDRYTSCMPGSRITVPTGEKSINIQFDTSGVSRTRATIEFRIRAYAAEIGALLEPAVNWPEEDRNRWPARLIIQPTAGPNFIAKMIDPGPPDHRRMVCRGGEADVAIEVDNIGDQDLTAIQLGVDYSSGYRSVECRFIVDGREGPRAQECMSEAIRIDSGDNPKNVKLRFYTGAMFDYSDLHFRVKVQSGSITQYAPASRATVTALGSCQPTFDIAPSTQSASAIAGETKRFGFTAFSVAGFSGQVNLTVEKVERCLDTERCATRQTVPRDQWQGITLSPTQVTLSAEQPTRPFELAVAPPFTLSNGRYEFTIRGQSQAITKIVYASLIIAGPQAYYLPQIADGQFGGYKITTRFVLVNLGGQTTAQIELTDNIGSSLLVRIPELGDRMAGSFGPIQLRRGGSIFLETDGSNPAPRTGAATVSSPGNLIVSAIYSIYDAAGRLQSHAGVLSSPVQARVVIPVLRSSLPNPARNTGVAFFNPTMQSASLTFSLYREDGGLSNTAQMRLPPRQHLSKFINESPLFPRIDPNFKGMLVIESSPSISAIALILDDLIMAGIPRAAFRSLEARRRFLIPQVADGMNPNEVTQFKSMFILNNPQAQSTVARINLSDGSGNPLEVTLNGIRSSTHTVTIPAFGSSFLETDGTRSLVTGAAVITSDISISAGLLYTLYDRTTHSTISMAGVADAPTVRQQTLPADYAQGRRVGLALFNPSEQSVTMTLKLIDTNGELQEQRNFTLNRFNQMAGFLDDRPLSFTIRPGFQGSMTITTDNPSGVSALGLNLKDGLMATIPLAEGASSNP